MTGAVTKPCGARTAADEDREELLIAFTDSVFGDSGKSISDPKAYMARRVFALRLNREYRHFLGEGLSHGRAAAAAIGRAGDFLSGDSFNKIPPPVCKREPVASCNPGEASGDIARRISTQTENAKTNIVPCIGSDIVQNGRLNIVQNVRSDIEPNVGSDIVQNVGSNIEPNVGSNIVQNVSSNIVQNVGLDIEPNVGSNVGSNIMPNVGSNIEPNVGSNIELNAGSNVEPNVGSNIVQNISSNIVQNVSSNIVQNVGSDIEPNVGSNIVKNVRSDIEPNAGSDIEPNAGSDIEPNVGSNIVQNVGSDIVQNVGSNIEPNIMSNTEPIVDNIIPTNTIMQENQSISEKSEVENKMKNSLKVYVDSLFQGAPRSEPVRELHDEILSNLEERYDDCIAGGMTPQRAYTAVVGTMGDIGKLIRQVSEENMHPGGLFERSSPTGKGIFKKYSYIFTDKNLKIIKHSAIAVMWILLVAFYFMISFHTDQWDFTWVVFLVGAGLNVAINMAGDIARFSRKGDDSENRIKILKSIHGSMSAILWLAATFFFFMICESHNYMFDRAWIIFILAAAVQVIMNAVIKIQINRYKD